MKESYWGYWLILLGVFIVVIMLLTQDATTTNTQNKQVYFHAQCRYHFLYSTS